jgi:hypothetical protein
LTVDILTADILAVNILTVEILAVDILAVNILAVDILMVDILTVDILTFKILTVIITRQKKNSIGSNYVIFDKKQKTWCIQCDKKLEVSRAWAEARLFHSCGKSWSREWSMPVDI